MFGRALKYDMKAVWRLWWIIAVSVGGLTVISSFVLRFIIANADRTDGNALLSFLWGAALLFFIVSVIAIFASSFGTVILVLMRFYKNFFTDEGYLTFTLPISRARLFFAKIVNAVIWNVLHFFLLVVCVLIACLLAPPPEKGSLINPVIYTELSELLRVIFDGIEFESVMWLALYVLEIVLMVFASAVITICLLHLCITIGAIIAKKAKVIAAIGIYYGTNLVFSTVMSVLGTMFMFGLMGGFIHYFTSIETLRGALGTVAVILFMVIAVLATVAVALYLITLDLIRKRLNLN